MSFRFDLDDIDRRRLVPALVLIAIGVLGLFSTLGWFGGLGGLPGVVIFGAAAYVAHRHGRQSGSRRWQLAAYPLAGLAIAAIAPGSLGGFVFLGSIGLVFALVHREDPDQWWAVIPAGTLFSLAATALVDGTSRSAGAGGSVFLLGLAATFFVLTRLPRHAQSWAAFPAAILAVLAVLGPLTGGNVAVPVLLIAIGAWMLLRPGRVGDTGATTANGATPSTAAAPVQAVARAAAAPAAGVAPSARSGEEQRPPQGDPAA